MVKREIEREDGKEREKGKEGERRDAKRKRV